MSNIAITELFIKGKVKEQYIEITNQDTASVDISGWKITATSKQQEFQFPKGILLAGGGKFRVYTNAVQQEFGGFSFGSRTSVWNKKGDAGHLYDTQGNLIYTWAFDSQGKVTTTPGKVKKDSIMTTAVQAPPIVVEESSWENPQVTQLSPAGLEKKDQFSRVAIYGDMAVASAPLEDIDKRVNSGAAYVFQFVNGNWQQIQKLTPDDLKADSYFGNDSALNQEHLIITAPRADDSGANSGSVYAFQLENGNWEQKQKLVPDDVKPSDNFGNCVALSGDFLIVGANLGDGKVANTGAAYIFQFEDGSWQQKQKLAPNDLKAADQFGYSVAVSGNTAIVGAYQGDDKVANTGTAYIFQFEDGSWQQKQKLAPNDLQNGNNFGISVGISGNIAIVGAQRANTRGQLSGAAYIFELTNNQWIQKRKLVPMDLLAGDNFGISVDVSGDVAIVGASGSDLQGADSGTAYIFQLEKGQWQQIHQVQHPNLKGGDKFGDKVAISGGVAMVGAPSGDTAGESQTGGIYIIHGGEIVIPDDDIPARPIGGVIPTSTTPKVTTLGPEGSTIEAIEFYLQPRSDIPKSRISKLLINGGWAVDKLQVEYENTAVEPPQTYVSFPAGGGGGNHTEFVIDPDDYITGLVGSWGRQAPGYPKEEIISLQFETYKGVQSPEFGGGNAKKEVEAFNFKAPEGCEIIGFFGAYGGHQNCLVRIGVYLREVPGKEKPLPPPDITTSDWQTVKQTKHQSEDQKPRDQYGCDVAIHGKTAMVGAMHSEANGKPDVGAVYVLTSQRGSWQQKQKLIASDLQTSDWFGYAFGYSLAMDGNVAIIGARDADAGDAYQAGAAYIFQSENGTWKEAQKLQASDALEENYFGGAVDISGSTAIVGSYCAPSGDQVNAGAAYIFQYEGETWQEKQRLQPHDISQADWFGYSVAIEGNTAVVGAICKSAPGKKHAGAVYIFTREDGKWKETQKLQPAELQKYDWFGNSVSISGKTIMVAAYYSDANVTNEQTGAKKPVTGAGCVYVYHLENGVWQQKQKLEPSDPQGEAFFGNSVDLNAGIAIVGAYTADTEMYNSGAAYLFRQLEDGTWEEKEKLEPKELQHNQHFGSAVAVSGKVAIVGARHAEVNGKLNTGTSYICELI